MVNYECLTCSHLYLNVTSRLYCHFIPHVIFSFLFYSVPHHLPLLKSHYAPSLSLSVCLLFFSVELRRSRAEPALPEQRGNQGDHLHRHHADLHPCLFHTNLPAAPLYTRLLRADRVGPRRSDPHGPRPWYSSAGARPQLCCCFSGYPLC